jgi:hypothetical protein
LCWLSAVAADKVYFLGGSKTELKVACRQEMVQNQCYSDTKGKCMLFAKNTLFEV